MSQRNKNEVIGGMDSIITIQRLTETEDEFGAKSIVWNNVQDVWAQIDYPSTKSDEEINGGLNIAITAVEFIIRFDLSLMLTQKDRIKYNNQFNIDEIFDIQVIKAPDRNGRLVISGIAAF